MEKSFKKMMAGYKQFRQKYVNHDPSIMEHLADHGQKPEIMVLACCDSRVDPFLILQCDPGDLFVVRNVANIVPPYESNLGHHGTSAALEYGICYLSVKHFVICGHSQCGGVTALLKEDILSQQDDFLSSWLGLIQEKPATENVDAAAKQALNQSYENCLTFPWIKQRVEAKQLQISRWFFEIKTGEIQVYDDDRQDYQAFCKG